MILNVLAKPKNGKTNKRNNFLYSIMENSFLCTIDDFSILRLFLKKYHVFHMHWPDRVLKGNSVKVIFKLLALWLVFLFLKFRNVKIVYTCHNPVIKFMARLRLKNFYYELIARFCDGIIFPSEYARKEFYTELAERSLYFNKIVGVIPLGLQEELGFSGSVMPREMDAADQGYLLLVGRISVDKGFDSTVNKLLSNKAYKNVDIIVAGDGQDSQQVENLKTIAQVSSHVKLIIRRLEDSEVNYLIRNCAAVVIDYKAVNSGVATLSAVLNRPVICSQKQFIASFKSQYQYDFIFPIGEHDIDTIKTYNISYSLSGRKMSDVAELTYQFYQKVFIRNV